MLSGVGWLVLVWVAWMVVSLVTAFLIRFALRGQQEIVEAQEQAIGAAQRAHMGEEFSSAPSALAPESARPTARPPQPVGPPIGAT